jgi:F-type H+-transporting ATPase subunit gamma
VKRTRDLELRLQSLETLEQAVTAMKSLSAHHLRETRAALEPAGVYREGVSRIVESTGASLPAGEGGVGLLIIGAELGFCGGYNSRVAAAGAEQRELSGEGPTFCLGHRAAKLLGRLGVVVDRVYTGPTSVKGITEVLLQLAQDMFEDYLAQGLSGFEIVASHFGGVGQYEVVMTKLLPIQVSPSPGAPQPRYGEPDYLRLVAVQELLYIGMVELLLDALAAEHGARLAAAQAAEHWLGERIEHLRRSLLTARREGTTQEVIEISAGARVHAERSSGSSSR